MDPEIVSRWPGKGPDAAGVCHSAVLHMLDVAAVAEVLMPEMPGPLRQACLLLAALHDLGKIGASFRAMLTAGTPQAAGRHWEVTEALLLWHDAALLAPALGSRDIRRRLLYAASAGHHGRPPVQDLELRAGGGPPRGSFARMLEAAGPQGVADAGAVIAAFLQLWPGASLEGLAGPDQAKVLSWRLAGLITAADWIGSDPAWFPPQDRAADLPAYLARTRAAARRAVAEAGLRTPPLRRGALFDQPPRPMQAACAAVPLPEGPALAVIEDETGSGKTEAALILAQRMLQAGKARGIYVALPTMATADAMFARVAGVLDRLFEGAPSLTLAHGRAALSERFRDLKLARDLNPDEPGPTGWLGDSRRRALLADVGVGTVDQALLAAVRVRHAPLRQFGLSSKVLIIDEAHEMGDPYMGALLEKLLHLQAAQGGSAILMSATLDLGLRSRLVAAFEAGAGRAAPALTDPAYPALTVPGVACPAVAARPSPRGPVAVNRLAAPEAALSLLQDAAAGGAACVWVRNAVDEAIAAVAALRAAGVAASLLHARFALVDRKRHEAAALATFGKGRAAAPGQVLVATQVVESSLDLDFDVMVSDLAPLPALVQRAGRLWRHMDLRPAAQRPTACPVLHVLSPDVAAVEGPQWAEPVLGKGAFPYDAALLWRSAKVLFAAREIRAPEGLRALIEAVEAGEEVPPPLLRAELTAQGQAGAARSHAGQNVIDWQAGYRLGAAGAPDADYPTRLGRAQAPLVLMRDGAPWAGGGWSVEACQMSEVSALASRVAALPLPAAAPPAGLPDWLTATRRFVAVGPEGRLCDGARYDAGLGLVFN
jgi:CRISPR-associated endonuclease/helicase Cas3